MATGRRNTEPGNAIESVWLRIKQATPALRRILRSKKVDRETTQSAISTSDRLAHQSPQARPMLLSSLTAGHRADQNLRDRCLNGADEGYGAGRLCVPPTFIGCHDDPKQIVRAVTRVEASGLRLVAARMFALLRHSDKSPGPRFPKSSHKARSRNWKGYRSLGNAVVRETNAGAAAVRQFESSQVGASAKCSRS